MKVEILGSGGATATPRPGCECRVCVEARERGVPYARTGPSLFVHGPNVLFDTPEESRLQLDRSTVTEIAACFYSHWHPDHTMGRRVWEAVGGRDFRSWPPVPGSVNRTDVYLPEQVVLDFSGLRGIRHHFDYLEQRGFVRVLELRDGETIRLGEIEVRPFRLHEDYVYAFELSGEGKRLLVAMDELHGWVPPSELRGADLAVLPMGLNHVDPFTGERRIHEEHPVLRFEATFEQTLGIVDALAAKRVVLSHVEEVDGLGHDDLSRLAARVGREIVFAYDTMIVDV
ncbi:MAG: MBL fold metallo-hydrolase [Gaiellaceae bacterium MAG52_C11]|nr:MBL fold metallo-hydrolase [Candidatus Gaiellasilicea maunaloa]